MSETITEPLPQVSLSALAAEQHSRGLENTVAMLEQRVSVLENRVAALPALPDALQMQEHVIAQVKARLPPPPPPIDPSQAPSMRDISLPIPSVQALVDTARTTWSFFEMLNDLKILFWTLVDRRYHMAWLTRVLTIGLLLAILTSHWWAPFASYDNTISRVWDKCIDLFLCLILFMILKFEARRYQEWRYRR